jgi:hypothetical protein
MRKVSSILALAVILVASSVDLGQSKSRPYDPADYLNVTPTEDHPWGGDNTGGGGTTGGTTPTRPTYTASTGNAVIDFFTYQLMQSRTFQSWFRHSFKQQDTIQPEVNPGTTTTQSN